MSGSAGPGPTIVPRIDDTQLPEEDRQRVDSIILLMQKLNGFIEQFRTDLEIFDFAESDIRNKHGWMHVAARDASMAIWDFGKALNLLQSEYKSCSPLRSKSTDLSLKAAIGIFGASFNNATDIRNSTGHASERIGSASERARNTLKHSPILIQGSLAGRRFDNSQNGRLVSFAMSKDNLAKLEYIRDAIFEIFSKVQPNILQAN